MYAGRADVWDCAAVQMHRRRGAACVRLGISSLAKSMRKRLTLRIRGRPLRVIVRVQQILSIFVDTSFCVYRSSYSFLTRSQRMRVTGEP